MDKSYSDDLKNIKGTFAVEGMSVSEETQKNLERLAEGRATCAEIVNELVKKYSQRV